VSGKYRVRRVPVVAQSHVLMLGSMLSNLRLWCGRSATEVAKSDTVATVPESATCPDCIRMMRAAHAQLDEWIPRLPKPPGGA
jgi:hypothetical protein